MVTTETSYKIDKEFVLSDSSVNVYDFCLMTGGYQMDMYLSNPIGYYMHDREAGVLVRWEDMRIEGDKILAKPVINLANPRGQQTVQEIESGFLNAASMGSIVVLEYEMRDNPVEGEDPMMVVTKWYNKECSLVDRGGNRNAVTELYDAEDNLIPDLADYVRTQKSTIQMAKVTIELTPENVSLLNLSDAADSKAVNAAIATVVQDLKNKTTEAATEKSKAEKAVNDLADYKTQATAKEVADLADAAVVATKLTKAAAEQLKTAYAGKPAELKNLIDAMPAQQVITDALDKNGLTPELKDLADKSWDDLDKANKLPMLKDKHPQFYAQKFREKYGKDPNN